MTLFNKIRLVIGMILFVGLGINFFYQVVKAFRAIRKTNYSEKTQHTFKCRECEDVYEMNGRELGVKTSIWSPSMSIKTPKGQTGAIRFECPQCHKKAFQEKIYDTDVTAMVGNVRAQFDDHSREVLIGILVKGFLPILIGALFISVLI